MKLSPGLRVRPRDGRKLEGMIVRTGHPKIPQWQIDQAVNPPASDRGIPVAWVQWDDVKNLRIFPISDLKRAT